MRAGGIYGPGRSALDSEEVEVLSSSEKRESRGDGDDAASSSSSSSSPSSSSSSPSFSSSPSSSSSSASSPLRQQPQEADRPTARVHVLDLCRMLRAQSSVVLDDDDGQQREEAGEEEEGKAGAAAPAVVVVAICNAVDGAPVPRRAALRAARELLGLAIEGEEEEAGGGERGNKNGREEEAKKRGKVVSGERSWSLSGISPVFPSVFEGLRAIHAGDARPFGEGRVPERRKRGRRGERGGGRS